MLDLGLKGRKFDIHQMYYAGSLSKTLYPLLSTGSTDLKNQHKQRILKKCYEHITLIMFLTTCIHVKW